MLSTLNLWTFLLPSLLVAGAPTTLSPGDTSLAKVRQAFETFNISTDMDMTFDPIVLFEVTFPQPDGTTVNVSVGGQLLQNVTAGPPLFSLCCDAGSDMRPGPFVVAAVDLDAPTPQLRNVTQVRHFLGGGFQLDARWDQAIWALANTTPASSEFLPPQPPQGSDPHRYVFLVFDESPGYANQTLVNPSTSPLLFNLSNFAAETQLGNPLGGTFMLIGPESATGERTSGYYYREPRACERVLGEGKGA